MPYCYSRLIRRLLNWRIQTRKLYPPSFFKASARRQFTPSTEIPSQNMPRIIETSGGYIFRRVEGSTTTAGSSVELLTSGGYRPGSCILLNFFQAHFRRPPASEFPKK